MHYPSAEKHDSGYTRNGGEKTSDQPHANHGASAFRKVHLVRLLQFRNFKNPLKIMVRISGLGTNGFIRKFLAIHPMGHKSKPGCTSASHALLDTKRISCFSKGMYF